MTAMISVKNFAPDRYLTMITRRGVMKRTCLQEYEYQRKGGKIALNLDEGDELAFVFHTDGEQDIRCVSETGPQRRVF